jgi:hypothetical protein
VASDVPHQFTGSGRVADVNGVVEVEFLHECRQIGGIRIHVIAGPGLARSPVTAAIVRNTAVPPIRKEHHLVFPGVAIQWRAVAEDNRLTGPPSLKKISVPSPTVMV